MMGPMRHDRGLGCLAALLLNERGGFDFLKINVFFDNLNPDWSYGYTAHPAESHQRHFMIPKNNVILGS